MVLIIEDVEDCLACGGTGSCSFCGGSGRYVRKVVPPPYNGKERERKYIAAWGSRLADEALEIIRKGIEGEL